MRNSCRSCSKSGVKDVCFLYDGEVMSLLYFSLDPLCYGGLSGSNKFLFMYMCSSPTFFKIFFSARGFRHFIVLVVISNECA